mgnify:CR=1 FL=1
MTLETIGKGDIKETIVSTSKKTDYDSGTVVRLEAVPSTGYYFSGWSFDVTSDTNPIEVSIDRPKTIKATFKKLSYELRVLTQGEGTVKEEIINTSKSTDYEFETTVRLTATPEEGSDFIEWEDSGAFTEQNPFEIIITEPKLVKAVFEYDLFNLGVGKWKIKKPKQSQKVAYDVYSIIFNRNRSFRLNYSSGQISGTYSVTSNSSIVLNNIGSLTNIQINQGQISFNLNITGLFQFNVTGSRVQTYQQNRTYIPDQNFEQALVDAGYDTTIDTYIDDSSMLGVTQLDLSNKQIADFTGLEEFVNLTDLNLTGNTITSVPLVNLNQLTTLNLSSTGLTELDLSQNSNITSLDLSGNNGLSCVKVSQQIYQQVPSGWIYDSTTSFELECDCPTLSLTSGAPIQELCDGDAMQSLVYEFGGTGTTINVGTMPSGLQSSISSGTLTISGTPVFTNNTYSFTVFTSDGNAGCSQVSQTVTISKKDSPELTLISGAYNQTISLGAGIVPIVVSYGGGTTGLTITGLPYTERGNTITISGDYLTGPFTAAGTYSATITTISSGGCTEITRNIQITIPYPGLGASPGGTTTGGTTTSGNTTTSGSTSSQAGIYFENGTCKCPNATVGDTEVINGTTYTVVNNSTIQGQVNAGNVNLCTTLVTNMSGIFKAMFLLIVLVGLGPLLKDVPKPVLSALLISVGIGIIDFKGMKKLFSLKNSDSLVLLLVVVLTVFVDLLVAVGIGMVLSSFFFMQRMGELVDQQSKSGDINEIEKKLKIPESIKNRIMVYELDGPLFYGFSDQFKEQAEAIIGKDAVIINMSQVPYIDASGTYVLEEVIKNFKDKKVEVILVGVKDHIFKQFEEFKVIPNTLAEEKAYNSVRAGLKYLKFQLEEKK